MSGSINIRNIHDSICYQFYSSIANIIHWWQFL